MKIRNNTGPSTVPCGMPDFGDCHDDLNPLTQTHCLQFVRKLLSQESEERENASADNLPIRPGMPTRSYALLRSRKAACTFSPLSIAICHFCTRKQSCVTVEWLGRNPDWCWKINTANTETKLRQLSATTCRSSAEHTKGSKAQKITHKKQPNLHFGWPYSQGGVTH